MPGHIWKLFVLKLQKGQMTSFSLLIMIYSCGIVFSILCYTDGTDYFINGGR